MVLDAGDRLGAHRLGDPLVDQRVIGGGVFAHQVHRGPVFLARLAVQVEPRQPAQLRRQLGVLVHRQLRIKVGDRRPRAAAAAVAKQREILHRLQDPGRACRA